MIWGLNHLKKEDFIAAVGYSLLIGLIYCGLYLAIGDPFMYGGEVWSCVLIWVVAQVAGLLFQLVKLPALIGMLLSGMLLKNAIPSSVAGLPSSWSKGLRACALGTIFLRSGLELDLKVFKRVGPVAFRLLLIPGLVEAFTDGGMAMGVFAMPVFYAFTLGFILKAVGPAVVIQTMFDTQKLGLGVEKGIPATIVAAASFDDMVAITGYSLFSNLAIRDPDVNLVWQLLQGPLDIVFGVIAGLVGAMFCSCTTIWNTRVKRTTAVFFTAQSLLFFLYHWDFKAGGALSCLVLGLVVNVLWEQGRNVPFIKRIPGFLSLGPNERYSHEVERHVGYFWRILAQPLLFGIIGTLMDFRAPGFEVSYLPKSLAIIAVGLAIRLPTTFLVVGWSGLTWKERLFVAFAWTPKATVQAALGPMPLDRIIEVYGPDAPEVVIGNQIMTTAIFAILICAPLGVMLIQYTQSRLLQKMDMTAVTPAPKAGTAVSMSVQTDDVIEPPSNPSSGDSYVKPEEKLKEEILNLKLTRDASLKSPSTSEEPAHQPEQQQTEITIAADICQEQASTPGLPKDVSSTQLTASAISSLTMDDAYETELLSSVDAVLARYLTSIEQLADLVDKQMITAEQSREYAATLRENVRKVRKQLLSVEGVMEHEEDAETATTFFRLADRLLQTSTATSTGGEGQPPAQARTVVPAEVELTQVAVARAV